MNVKTQKLIQQLNDGEAALLTDQSNRLYLTGFPSSAGAVLVTKNHCVFFTDFRYYEKACSQLEEFDVVMSKNLMAQVKEITDGDGISTLYLPTENLSVCEFSGYREFFGKIVSDKPKLDEILQKLRRVKSDGEIRAIKRAQQFTDKTFEYILSKIEPGKTEREIALDMEFYMRSLGSDGTAFDFIVVSGKNSSLPHGVPTDKKVEKGDFVTMDFGAVSDGYRSDMTRTVAVGKVSEEQCRVYDTVLSAQNLALREIRSGKVCRDIDSAARQFIDSNGFENCFGHGLGHSVGIDIHESPAFNTRCETILEPGMIMTVEPGIYLSGAFGVRIEDMVVVTDTGCENLTRSEKELIIL